MVLAMERKRDGVVDFDQQLIQRSHSGALSLDSRPETPTSLPTILHFESTDPIQKISTTNIETNNEAERSMSLREGIRLYPKAITWSVLLSMTLIMEGFSTILVPNLFAMQAFRKQFGSLRPTGLYEINADWQSALVNGGLAGQIVGLFATGTLAERIGYRYTLMIGLVAMSLFILVPFFATDKNVLLIGQCLLGMPWGMFQCICTVYAADVCPVALRAYLTT
jgi:SP family general alpha glucoside:H+ symporter-like MFS transporter